MTKFHLIASILVFIGLNSYSQNSILKFETSFNKYFFDTIEYNQIDITIRNSSSDDYVLWIDYKNRDSLTVNSRINQYFYSRKGDFTLSNLLYEELSNELPIQLYVTFYKILRQIDQFVFSLIIKGNDEKLNDILANFKKQIVIIKSNESKRLPPIEDLERYNYKGKSITILEDMIINN